MVWSAVKTKLTSKLGFESERGANAIFIYNGKKVDLCPMKQE
jgi:hypothetical protein